MALIEFIMNFLPDLLGAAVGAFLGYYFGVKLERSMRIEQNKEEKRNLLISLLNEIKNNQNEFSRSPKKRVINEVMVTELSKSFITASYNSAINSGKFSILEPDFQKDISYIYHTYERLNENRTKLYNPRMNREELLNMSKTINVLIIMMNFAIPGLIKKIDNKLSG